MNRIKNIFISIFTDRRLFITLASIIGAGIVVAFLLDFLIMPSYTNYNEGITVPDVTKVSLDEATSLLDEYGLRHEVLDRRANSAYPADYIIDQAPSAQQIVKPNRKVYLTVNTATTPQTVVPDVVNMSLRNAEIQLENHGLTVGTKSYESSRFRNTILRQSVAAGDTVSRGTVVNLAVSDGLGSRIVEVPDVVGLRLSEAQQTITKAGLRVGEVRFQPSREFTPNTVISYSPDEEELTEGESLFLIVAERFDAREAVESGAIIDDSTSVNQQNQNPENQE
ncbi:PASTA domain-containing protein [Rhodohalobacter sulfatireducens]|jgi:beta-lactam-binding protein with PASTA domain|uniref:PASTA domain-containing protein n=1 Tax=Rhodohalobacter sulfatireducens TaxID=2911366 RepID=A0ABS9KH44_9BACT|nr:PASTA domain-containing protein [Rhodohalobacter sulfatireducens]MCG2590168.1 PASTA domain-containing protein [Rhodohalobacter sulfatireducens]MDR9365249.1 PASTA domain-containing protein [Balneolaceae bacterium]MDR9408521.1 PASTA domain-containing protein [Balneolaceae bacterium]